jgi:hypothetical protein
MTGERAAMKGLTMQLTEEGAGITGGREGTGKVSKENYLV